jgi:predicted nucleic acid-binding protein
MTGPVFVDTNVLVYSRDPSDPAKQQQAAEWLAALWDGGSGRLSVQVLQEFYVTLVRKLDPPANRADVRDDIAALATWNPVATDPALFETAWAVEDRYGFSWWDALIVAQALAAGCDTLLTEDLRHDQDVFGIRIVNPFREGPAG